MRRGGGLGECRDCREPIRFVQIEDTGRRVPVDPKPNDHGNVCARLVAGKLYGFVISKTRGWASGHERYTPHFATCEERVKKPAAPAPEPDPFLF